MSLLEKNVEPKKTKLCSMRSPLKIVKAAGMIFGNLENVDFDPKIDCPPHACYNCWSLNHQSKVCHEKVSRLYCCNCGRKDVKVTECARCSKAFFELHNGLKMWISSNFLTNKNGKDHDKKQAKKIVDMNWDEDKFQSFYSCDYENGKDVVQDYVKINWESRSHYTQPNDLFAYMRSKKIEDEFASDKTNNVAMNLDDTRMADRDSFGENSNVSIQDFSKKDEETTGEPLPDFLKLLDAVKHMSVHTQEVIILQFMSERKKHNEMQKNNQSKMP